MNQTKAFMNKNFTVSYLDKTVSITEYQARTYSEGSMVSLLNRKDFNLGNGHEIQEMVWIDENEAVLRCVPYMGAPTQNIHFNLKQ